MDQIANCIFSTILVKTTKFFENTEKEELSLETARKPLQRWWRLISDLRPSPYILGPTRSIPSPSYFLECLLTHPFFHLVAASQTDQLCLFFFKLSYLLFLLSERLFTHISHGCSWPHLAILKVKESCISVYLQSIQGPFLGKFCLTLLYMCTRSHI